MVPVKIDLIGFKELEQLLSRMPNEVATKIAREGVRAGIEEIRKAIRIRAPQGLTGRLKKKIMLRFVRNDPKYFATYLMQPIYYAKWVEEGTKPHKIPKRAIEVEAGGKVMFLKILRRRIKGGSRINPKWKVWFGNRLFAKQVEHPGTKPKPFWEPGFESSVNTAIRVCGDSIWERIEKYWSGGGTFLRPSDWIA